MAKKASGLGRGLDELLDDNTPSLRENKGRPLVEARGEIQEIKKTPVSSLYDTTPRSLYDTKPRTKSVKSNFKNKK
ncbi:MAG: hypothetical protein J6U86_01920 [Clostridia bacterium]|nr:hypothetical protein [Clostridia bacterium]